MGDNRCEWKLYQKYSPTLHAHVVYILLNSTPVERQMVRSASTCPQRPYTEAVCSPTRAASAVSCPFVYAERRSFALKLIYSDSARTCAAHPFFASVLASFVPLRI